jgi:S-adenosylmethionine hydrolase
MENSRDFKCFRLKEKKFFRTSISSTFHARDIFAPVAAHLSLGVKPSEFGPPHPRPQRIEFPAPEIKNNREILGEIIHIDGFGNLIANIQKTHLSSIAERVNHVELKEKVIPLLDTYSDAPLKSPLAVIGSNGFLEISVNRGNASKDLCISKGDKVFLMPRLSKS